MVDRRKARDIEWTEAFGNRGRIKGPNNLARRKAGMEPIDDAGVQANREKYRAIWSRLQGMRARKRTS